MEEDESISAQIDESSADNNSDEELIRMDDIEYIWDGSYLYLNMNTKDSRLRYMTILENRKMNEKEENYQQIIWGNVYIKYFRLL